MKAAILRLARILVAQAISWSLLEWGGVTIPTVNITVGAAINTVFKFIRDKFPNSKLLEWLPI
jgi:hypothetical protein